MATTMLTGLGWEAKGAQKSQALVPHLARAPICRYRWFYVLVVCQLVQVVRVLTLMPRLASYVSPTYHPTRWWRVRELRSRWGRDHDLEYFVPMLMVATTLSSCWAFVVICLMVGIFLILHSSCEISTGKIIRQAEPLIIPDGKINVSVFPACWNGTLVEVISGLAYTSVMSPCLSNFKEDKLRTLTFCFIVRRFKDNWYE